MSVSLLSTFCMELARYDSTAASWDSLNEWSECTPGLCPCFQLGLKAATADVREETLINLDAASQPQSHLPRDPPTKTGTHLGVHPPAVKVSDVNEQRTCSHTYALPKHTTAHAEGGGTAG